MSVVEKVWDDGFSLNLTLNESDPDWSASWKAFQMHLSNDRMFLRLGLQTANQEPIAASAALTIAA